MSDGVISQCMRECLMVALASVSVESDGGISQCKCGCLIVALANVSVHGVKRPMVSLASVSMVV